MGNEPQSFFSRMVPFIVAAIIANAILIPVFAFRSTTELDVYLKASERLVAGEDLYIIEKSEPAYSYPPLFALATTPLLPFSENVQRIIWCGIQVTLAVGLLILLWNVVGPRLSGASEQYAWPSVLYWGILIVIGGRYVLSPLENQSHDLVIAVLVAAAAVFAGLCRDFSSGVAAGIATAFKATPLLFLPVFIVQRRWLACIGMIGAILVSSITPDLMMPRNDGEWNITRWVQIAAGTAKPGQSGGEVIWKPWNHLNQNLSGTVFRLTSPPPKQHADIDVTLVMLSDKNRAILTTAAQIAILAIVIVGVLGWNTRRIHLECNFRVRHLAEAGAVACGMILLSPMSSKAHYCILLIALAAVVCEFVRRKSITLGVMLGLILFINLLSAKGLIGKHAGNLLLAAGVQTWSCVLILFALLFVLLTRQSQNVSAE